MDNFLTQFSRLSQTIHGTLRITLVAMTLFLFGCGGATQNTSSAISPLPSDAPPALSAAAMDTSIPSADGPYGTEQAEGILVKFNSQVPNRTARSVLKTAGVAHVESFTLVEGLSLAKVSAGQSMDAALAALKANPSVEYAEPNYVVSSFVIPNDTNFPRQYGLHNTGQTGGSNDADIDAPEAWDITTGTDTIIAVIDTGVDYNHPDLSANIWVNTAEIANNGIDDDRNGYVDDVRGWDFANNDANPMDDNRHGTHVAGIVGARGNNAVGVAGVNWSVRIMPLKFMTATGAGNTANAIRALQYAVRMGAKVSNNSWGGGARSQALFNAISAANNAGHLFVAAAGNTGANNDTSPSFPANFNLPNIISVTATDRFDRLPAFANTGPTNVDLAAPGVAILSTTPNNNYASLSGTSMAAPFVSGAAGLVLSVNPGISVSALKSALLDTVDPVPALNGRVLTGGRLNAFNAVRIVAPTLAVSPRSVSIPVGGRQQFTASGGGGGYTWTVSNPSVGNIDNSGVFVATAVGTTNVIATDNAGRSATATVTVTALTITPSTAQLGVNQTLQFTASGGTASYTWTSSNPSVASVGATTGLVRGIAPGTTTLTVSDANNVTATSGTITVVSNGTAAVTVAPGSVSLAKGATAQLSASGGNPPYTWTTTNAAVATVSASGLVTAVAPGTATITATDSAGGQASSTVQVRDIQVETATQATTIAVNSSVQMVATGGVSPYTWSVDSPSVASISASGVLTGLSPGTVVVTATDADGIAGSTTITVANANAIISVTPQTVNVPRGWWVRFTAGGGTPPYSWSISNPAAGTIDATTGWFRASNAVGASTTVNVTDANGNLGQATANVIRH